MFSNASVLTLTLECLAELAASKDSLEFLMDYSALYRSSSIEICDNLFVSCKLYLEQSMADDLKERQY